MAIHGVKSMNDYVLSPPILLNHVSRMHNVVHARAAHPTERRNPFY